MALIIPYQEGIGGREGAFLTPNGKKLEALGRHEKFARNYCQGNDRDLLSICNGNEFLLEKELSQIDNKESHLQKEELELYKRWILTNARRIDRSADFLVLVLGYDKIEIEKVDTISTTSRIPHIRFFNYYLMDWRIDSRIPMVLDKSSNTFTIVNENRFFIPDEEREAEEEIEEICAKVKMKDRPLFFK